MSSRRVGGPVAIAVAAVLGFAALMLALRFPEGDPHQLSPLITAAWGMGWLIPSAFVVWHRPRELMGNLMLSFCVLLALTTFSQVIQLHVHLTQSQTFQATLFTGISTALYVSLGMMIGLLVHLFPTGQPPSATWRWPVRALLVCGPALVVGQVLGVNGAQSPSLVVKAVAGVLGVGYALGLVSAIPSLGYRVWSSSGIEREQVKWFLLAVVLATLGWFVSAIPLPLRIVFIVALPPLAIAVALVRYRLYDIDRIISRTASYGVVTGVLLATYAVVVTSVTRLLPDSSTLAVAAATLAAAALARPLLRRVQKVVDRRFNRARYDAERTVDAFGSRLRAEIDTPVVVRDLRDVVHQTLEPQAFGVWLRGEP